MKIAEMHALLPRFYSELGHVFSYHTAVEKALHSIGWSYFAYVPKKTALSSLPPSWKSVLANDISDRPKSFWDKLKFFFGNIRPFFAIFRKIEKRGEVVLFIEHFELSHLASLWVALSLLKPEFHFWILHRYEFEGRKLKAFLHRLFLKKMRRKFGEERVKCLTDSELLAESLRRDLQCPVFVVPIPHTEAVETGAQTEESGYRFWWPGGLIREDKGLSKIKKLLSLLEKQEAIRLVAAESARGIFTSPKIDFIPTFLKREDYLKWMQTADLILLPYSGADYAQRTSGIFVEAICSGAVPVTTKGTWMAYELGKFQLSELVFTWDEPNLLDRLRDLSKSPTIKEKLKAMQTHYQMFHSPEGFAKVLTRF